jgi:hypothetical protein
MSILNIVDEILATGILMAWQEQFILTQLQQGDCSLIDLEAVTTLITALVEGKVRWKDQPKDQHQDSSYRG